MKYKVVIKPEQGEALSNLRFNDEAEADAHIAGLRESDELFARTTHDLLIVVKYALFNDEWVEVARESLLR